MTRSLFASASLLILSLFPLQAGEPGNFRQKFEESIGDLQLLAPPWKSSTIYRESIIPLQLQEQGPVIGRLAFEAVEILEVRSADRKKNLKIGTDVSLAGDRRTIEFAPLPDLPVIKHSEFYPPPNSPHSYAHRLNHPEQWMLYAQGHWWHDRQFEVTYRRKNVEWSGPIPKSAESLLPKTLDRLRNHSPLTLGVSGDSISSGLNASGVTDAPPYMPPYPDLVAMQLQAACNAEISLVNRAVPGWSISNGIDDLENLLAANPHLIIVAYGMNDVGRRDPEWFRRQYRTFLDKLRNLAPDSEVILVTTMVGNREWVHTPREMFDKYRDVLLQLEAPGIAVADVTSVWNVMLEHKHDYDLTGNGLNHPNDFGFRLYAQTILPLLIPPEVSHSGSPK